MPVALNLEATKDFILTTECNEDGTPKPGATVFVIGTMNSVKHASLASLATRISTDDIAFERYINTAIRYGLKGWHGFLDGNGSHVKFDTDGSGHPTDVTISRIPADDLVELALAIIRFNRLTPAELGN